MQLSKVNSKDHNNYLNSPVKVQSAYIEADGILKAFHNMQAVVHLTKINRLSATCKSKFQTLVVNLEHILVV
jgi:hypothetical protein